MRRGARAWDGGASCAGARAWERDARIDSQLLRSTGRGWYAISRMPGGAVHDARRTLRGFGCDCDRRRTMGRGPRCAVRFAGKAGGGAGHVSLFKKTQKSPHGGGLDRRVDRLGVRVPVTLNANRHVRNIAQCAIVEVQQNAILSHPRNKPHV